MPGLSSTARLPPGATPVRRSPLTAQQPSPATPPDASASLPGGLPPSIHPLEFHQPFVHDLTGVFSAPVQAWSLPDGSMHGSGAHGIYAGDTRIVSRLTVEALGGQLSPLPVQVVSAREVVHTDAVSLLDGTVDPLLLLRRARRADTDGVTETLTLTSADPRPRALSLRVRLGVDDTSMSAVKDPRILIQRTSPLPSVTVDTASGTARWVFGPRAHAALRTDVPMSATDSPWEIELSVELHLDGPGSVEASWRLEAQDPSLPFAAPAPSAVLGAAAERARAASRGADDPERRAVADLVARSLGDLDALRLRTHEHADEVFYAAGAPWFFTLFGRDALIAASLALPVDPEIAWGTLRTLGARQGRVRDPETAEQPGKILHEVRAEGMDMVDSHLPPVYYGTIDATPLWIELLHEAWSAETAAGSDEATRRAAARVRVLRPQLEGAATWLLEHADADRDGFLEYIDESGHGLTNQGWKDSGDSVRRADGSLAEGSIALAEVQGYAYAAALHAAELFEGLDDGPRGSAGTDETAALPARLRLWAAELRERFRAAFWCTDELGAYVALALDGSKRPVDGVASNMGHLLGTGLLDAEEEAVVVRRLLHPSMFSGYGIRTLSTTNAAYWPLRYHGGSVWTHDTGYILRGMLRAGFRDEAQVLARGLLRASEGFDRRMPELFGGQAADEVWPPVPYPASCRPQAWAAATAVTVAQALDAL